MTRLNGDHMQAISRQYKENEIFLLKQMKYSFLEIGNRAMNKTYSREELESLKVACIPVTSGLGEIGDFCKNLAGILSDCCGVNAFETINKDIAGIQEAYDRKADIVFMGDDSTFTAFNLKNNLYVDNGRATGRGFAAALELAAGGIANREVLLLGAGPVGCAGADYLQEKKARVKIYDQSRARAQAYASKNPQVEVLSQWEDRSWDYILEATNEAGIITRDQINSKTICAAPGVPLGIAEDAREGCKLVIHNLLELGIITMLSGVGKEVGGMPWIRKSLPATKKRASVYFH